MDFGKSEVPYVGEVWTAFFAVGHLFLEARVVRCDINMEAWRFEMPGWHRHGWRHCRMVSKARALTCHFKLEI